MNKWIAGLLFVIVLMGGCGSKTISENGGSKGNSAQAGNTAQNNTMITGKPESNQSNVQNEVPDPITPAVGESAGSKDEPSELPAQNTPVPEASFLYPVMKDDKWGYIDAEGNLVIDYKFDYAGFFTDGAATVRIGGKESLMAPDGKFLIEPAYDFCGNYSEGLAHVVLGEDGKSRHGFADLTGRVFFRDYFNNNTGSFHDGLACFEKNGKFGYVNTEGDIVIEPSYDFAYDFSEGLAMVADMDKCGFINMKNELVIPMIYDHYPEESYLYQGFSNGLAVVCADGKYGYIDTQGNYRIPPKFGYAERFCEGLALVCEDGLWGYIDEKEDYAITPQFQYASSFSGGYAFARLPGQDDPSEYGGFGLIDKTGRFVTPTNLYYEYGGGYTFAMEWSSGFVGDLARVILEDAQGIHYVYISKNGDIVWEMEN